HTEVGADAFLGAGTLLVAPTSVANGGRTGAGAVVTKTHPVPAGETYVGVPAKALKKSTKSKIQSPKSKAKKPKADRAKGRTKRKGR
ncbi:MAG: hypothetical protein NT049_09695, partial [Planctomycetota bacterium]|nr:hypothetical protein [Planctomycetota bacterium]